MSNEEILMAKIVEFIQSTSYSDIPNEMVSVAKSAIVDTVGVSIAGWYEPAVQKILDLYTNVADVDQGEAFLWGSVSKTNCETAALVNGTAAHVLDFDDATNDVFAHPSAPILAATIPMAEKLNKTGKEVITSYVIGTEVMIKIGLLMGNNHYELGWHTTGTLGIIGATASCANLLSLNHEQTINAIAIAASMAGGLQKNFGTMTKPLHVGLAASHAIQATMFANIGITGNSKIFGERGFLHAFCGGDMEGMEDKVESTQFGAPFALLSDLSVKKFPCCYATHKFIQGALDLKERYQISIDNVKEIKLSSPPVWLLPLVHSRPINGLQAKFSAEYTVLSAIADGYVKLRSFEDQQVKRPQIQKMLSHVKVLKDLQQAESQNVSIQITLNDGQILNEKIEEAPGSHSNPLKKEEHQEKWMDCLMNFSRNPKIMNVAPQKHTMLHLYEQAMKIDQYSKFGDWMLELKNQLILKQR